ncbi:hypothetical protein ACIOC2_07965 [Streptomyces sp. NPDC088337]|nr:hypothetical protein [Streptomyces sp. NBC_01788]WSB24728.1 hypothetical protein OIE49_01800 [Streptomyces sp. NBC_01788]
MSSAMIGPVGTGPGTSPDADLGFPRIRATGRPAPFNRHARTLHRRDA